MRFLPVVAVGLSLLTPTLGWTAVSCPDRTPATITKPAAGSLKCQKTIGKAGVNYAKTKLKALGKCLAQQIPGACPDLKTADKINAAASKSAAKIANACEPASVQAGLATSYNALTDANVIGSCVLSQHQASLDILLGEINGMPGRLSLNSSVAKCVKTLNKAGVKQATGVHKILNKCIAAQEKLGTAGDLAPICVGHWAGGSFVAPTDVNAAAKLSTLQGKTEAAVAKDCVLPSFLIKDIYACPGASTVADLQACLVCDSWDGVLDLVAQENSEAGTYVGHAAGALQTAVDGAAAGTKLLIGEGEYFEQVTITTTGLHLVGCGGATGNYPKILPPADANPHPQGITANGVDGLSFQSLWFSGWDENGVFISGADGISFRDCIANDNDEYGIFPVTSNNVVVESCDVADAHDTGIYVGQSTNILVRYNHVHDNVSGIEIENSANAVVENNYSTNNTAGILTFKLPDPPVQLANGHHVFDNVILNNNSPNASTDPSDVLSHVPDGTGMIVLSVDSSEFDHNLVQGNGSFGFALVDQKAIDDLLALNGDPPVFGPNYSADQTAENNSIHDNVFTGNGTSPDTTDPNSTPLADNIVFFIHDDTVNGNCFASNTVDAGTGTFLTSNDCP